MPVFEIGFFSLGVLSLVALRLVLISGVWCLCYLLFIFWFLVPVLGFSEVSPGFCFPCYGRDTFSVGIRQNCFTCQSLWASFASA
jgi:hypothetical protein